ncbi:MAG TPA: zinc metalloprotease HtpX [Phycisphaerae bacterium]|nr:zinc metalloprotease HtpX [Phycisphaerae bacterium]
MNTTLFNGFKTAVLLGLMTGLCLVVGYVFGGEQGMFFGLVVGGGMSLGSYFFSDRLALAAVGAQPVSREQAPELYDMVAQLSQRAGLPMPRLYFSPEQAPNAFATGRNPAHGVVCVTAGLMNMMTPPELEGVIGHELSHIKHRDILISTIAAIMAAGITYAAHMMMWFGGGGRDRDNPLGIVGVLLSIILAPIAAGLLQMAISRSREYAADASGAQLAGGPEGLISALRKLAVANEQIPMNINPAQSPMFIVMPLAGESRGLMDLFRTHPPTEKRIAKLLEMMGKPNPYSMV